MADAGNMTKYTLGLMAIVAALVIIPSAAAFQTPTRAYQTARACLLDHGARYVSGGSSGGTVFFKGVPHIQYWNYQTVAGLVDKVTYFAFPGLPPAKKQVLTSCVMKGN